MGEVSNAVELLVHVRSNARRSAPRVLQAWLAAACGEAYAAEDRRGAALRAFDEADALLCLQTEDEPCPYVALDAVHLTRWRGHALARLRDAEAIAVLKDALSHLDPTFIRAQASLRVDLAIALMCNDMTEDAWQQKKHARALVDEIGSERQRRRILSSKMTG